MNCPSPKHERAVKMIKNHLDCFYCSECDHDWLIHPYKNEARGRKKKK